MKRLKRPTVAIITFPAGGPLSWGRQLADGLTKRGFDVSFFAGRADYIRAQFRYFDIVHTCVPIPHFLNKKYILTIKGNFLKEKRIARPFFHVAIKRANAITVPSMFLKKELGIHNALIIPNGIDIPSMNKSGYALVAKFPTIGILTNFHFRPKAEGVVRLARIIHNAIPEAKLIVGGSGSFLEEYTKKTTAIHANTEFLGQCRKEDLFARIDIFAYYSLFDNQPNAILEAMAYGLPVLSNDVGAVREIMRGNMRTYLCGDDSCYARAILDLVGSQEKRKMCAVAALERIQAFRINDIMEKYIELY